MNSQELRNLREKMEDILATYISESLSSMGQRDLIEAYVDLAFSGGTGIGELESAKFLEHFKDELYEAFETEEDDNFHMDNLDEIRDLAARFELELVVEKELLG